ncbi:hypothetical protein [Stakelama tenebrarum]|uniref:Uncharacterized protein n=1 Tax=Stakelama tenebrarum TaxID=2711215 RepID=A0A6G6Y3F0_9SPHN|nr:hypothetical protein [Sphingosinithalassobacter tenebrarum]QIG79248.1 hypothetical protein G5C33_05200 [Sphingosinithalassobacter tenebrarum]
MQERLWTGAVAAILLAIFSGVADHRRQRRRDPDRVGLIPWTSIQFVALMVAVILGGLALDLF